MTTDCRSARCSRTRRPEPSRAYATSSERVRSVFSNEKKLSIGALSQTFPERLIDQVTPWSAMRRWNGSLVYWLP